MSRPRKPMPPGREATRRPRPAPAELAPPRTGWRIVQASWAGSVLLVIATGAAVADPGGLGLGALVVALAMFFGGLALFAWSFLIAVGRSREVEVSLGGVYGLTVSAPAAVRWNLFGSLAAEIVVAIGGAVAQPRTSLAFGILAVMWGLGLAGLWGANHAVFPPRRQVATGRPRRSGR